MPLICRQCGSENTGGAAFCSSCQATLGAAVTQIEEVGSAPPPDLEERVRAALASEVRIVRELGRGGMAVVYEGLDLHLNRKVAVKCLPNEATLDRELVQRFQMEAKLAAGLNHPHIVPIFAVGVADRIHYFTMAFCQGGSLEDRIRRGLSLEETVEIVCQIASALDYAHRKDLVHRDVKPSNVMFDEHGTVRVLDFGIARLLSAARLTVTRAVLGTPDYMSPEQALSRPIDGRSDLYSLGVIFYKMLTGQLPFEAEEPLSVIYKHVHERPNPPHRVREDVPQVLSRVVLRLMSKEPEKRYTTGAELIEDLRSPEVQLALHPRHQRRTDRHRAIALKRRWTRASLLQRSLLALLPLLAIAAWLVWPATPAPSEPSPAPLTTTEQSATQTQPAAAEPSTSVPIAPEPEKSAPEQAPPPAATPEKRPRRRPTAPVTAANTPQEKPPEKAPVVDPLPEKIRQFRFVDILPEPFKMGQMMGGSDMRPAHKVVLSPYGISATEVTQELWEMVMGDNPSCNKGLSFPVENVSWNDVATFIERLNARTNGSYRLPTEAEWEYACRQGRNGRYGPIALEELAWYKSNAAGPQPVGSKRANGLGIHDLQGNVWEWCLDIYDATYYSKSPERDPRGPTEGSEHVLRGGAYDSPTRDCQSQNRHKQPSGTRSCTIGFRLAYGR